MPDSAPLERRPLGRLKLAAALLLAAVLVRMLAFEIRRIPTSSMVPTLLGDDTPGAGGGDRVLVDRVTPMLRAPRRFEILALARPDDREREIVKRAVGLPRETIRIEEGDLFVNGERLRKNAAERRSQRVPLFRSARRRISDGFSFDRARVEENEQGGVRIRAADRSTPCAEACLSNRIVPTDGFEGEDGAFHPGDVPVSDLILEATIRILGPRGTAFLDLRDEGEEFRAAVERLDAAGETRIRIERSYADEGPVRRETIFEGPGPRWAEGEARTLTLSDVDRRLSFEIDGVEVVPARDLDRRHPIARLAEPLALPRINGARLGVYGADGEVGPVALYRDLHYLPRGKHGASQPFLLGPDEYFVLGDRSSDSDDSRDFGAVPRDRVLGLVRATVSPWSRRRWLP